MGYRSQVVLAVDEKIAPAFMAMLAKETQAHDLCFRDSDEVIAAYGEEGSFLFRWDHIKWYDSYPEITAIQEFMEAANENDLSDYGEPSPPKATQMRLIDPDDPKSERREVEVTGDWTEHFRFLRIGEDYSDVEEWGHGYEIWMSRSIDY